MNLPLMNSPFFQVAVSMKKLRKASKSSVHDHALAIDVAECSNEKNIRCMVFIYIVECITIEFMTSTFCLPGSSICGSTSFAIGQFEKSERELVTNQNYSPVKIKYI